MAEAETLSLCWPLAAISGLPGSQDQPSGKAGVRLESFQDTCSKGLGVPGAPRVLHLRVN